MSKEKKRSIKAEYEKIRVSGHQGFGRGEKGYVNIGVRDFTYGVGEAASQTFTIKEAKEIIGLLEQAIEEATKKEKK